jgi:alpha-L-fucosidase
LTVRTLLSRRDFIKTSAVAAGLQLPAWRTRAAAQSARTIARGPFQPTWESLVENYRVPEWFRDAKFGVWARWSAQCVPEQGDWYARQICIQGNLVYDYHVKTYGHPSKFGFMEINNLWKEARDLRTDGGTATGRRVVVDPIAGAISPIVLLNRRLQ